MAPESKRSVMRLIERAKPGSDTAAKHLIRRTSLKGDRA
jgi:hypothetical protein